MGNYRYNERTHAQINAAWVICRYHEKLHALRNAVWVITDIKKHTNPKKWSVGNFRLTERYMPNDILWVNRIKMAGVTYLIKSTV